MLLVDTNHRKRATRNLQHIPKCNTQVMEEVRIDAASRTVAKRTKDGVERLKCGLCPDAEAAHVATWRQLHSATDLVSTLR